MSIREKKPGKRKAEIIRSVITFKEQKTTEERKK